MTDDTKDLLKGAVGNIITILGYISTALTFLPIMAVVRPYLRPLGVILILVGIFRGAGAVISAKNKQRERAEFLERQRRANLRRSGG